MWAGLLALGLAAAALWRGLGGYAPRPAGDALSRRELACLDAVAEAIFPPGGAIEASGVDVGVACYVDRLAAASQPRQRALMRLLLVAFEHATLLFPAPGGWRGFRRFSALPLAQRQAALERWRTSRLFARRLVFTSLRALATMGYLADRGVQRRLGFEPYAIDTPVCEADLLYPRIGRSRAVIGHARRHLTPPSDGTPLAVDGPRLERSGGERP